MGMPWIEKQNLVLGAELESQMEIMQLQRLLELKCGIRYEIPSSLALLHCTPILIITYCLAYFQKCSGNLENLSKHAIILILR